jgi:RNA-binding protein
MRELDRALAAHELIKVHAAIDEREDRARLLETLCQALQAQPVQVIGKMLVAYRPRPPQAEPAPRPAGKTRRRSSTKPSSKAIRSGSARTPSRAPPSRGRAKGIKRRVHGR